MPGSLTRHDAQTVTTFTFESMDQTPRLFMSEFGCFTTPIAEHGPILILKIAGHLFGTQPSSAARMLIRARETREYLLSFEIRFPLFEKCTDAFVFIFAREA